MYICACMYKLLFRPLLFLFPPEKAHNITLSLLKAARYIPGCRLLIRLVCKRRCKMLERELFGIRFPNPVGIAAGLDKNGECYNDFANLGFGFMEIGAITPDAQEGNPAPRLWRLPKDHALVNCMGMNNVGVKAVLQHLRNDHPNIIIGANISKNATTANEEAYKDYSYVMALLYDFVDFFVVNVSCPNVKDLDRLQEDGLPKIIEGVMEVVRYNEVSRPVLLKVSPDMTHEQLDRIIHLALINGVDGIVATNTTRSRDQITAKDPSAPYMTKGGLSGAPLYEKSLEAVKYIHAQSRGLLPIIASGGIMTPAQAEEMLSAGASLVEVYTGFIYEGPLFAKRIIRHLKKVKEQ